MFSIQMIILYVQLAVFGCMLGCWIMMATGERRRSR